MKFAQTAKQEQETIINRMRSDKNLIYIYSSDSRIMKKVLNLSIADTVIRVSSDKKEVVAIECTLPIKDFRKTVFLPLFKGN